jgi:hypothetical protein
VLMHMLTESHIHTHAHRHPSDYQDFRSTRTTESAI